MTSPHETLDPDALLPARSDTSAPTQVGPVTPLYPLHGAFALRDTEKGYVVVEFQHGAVTAMDDESITVTSVDGYTRRYVLDEAELRASELQHGVRLTPGCRVVVTASTDHPARILGIDEPREDETFPAAFVPVPN